MLIRMLISFNRPSISQLLLTKAFGCFFVFRCCFCLRAFQHSKKVPPFQAVLSFSAGSDPDACFKDDGAVLRVRDAAGAAVQIWNSTAGNPRLKTGDRIVRVNGFVGDAAQLRALCLQGADVTMDVERDRPLSCSKLARSLVSKTQVCSRHACFARTRRTQSSSRS